MPEPRKAKGLPPLRSRSKTLCLYTAYGRKSKSSPKAKPTHQPTRFALVLHLQALTPRHPLAVCQRHGFIYPAQRSETDQKHNKKKSKGKFRADKKARVYKRLVPHRPCFFASLHLKGWLSFFSVFFFVEMFIKGEWSRFFSFK